MQIYILIPNFIFISLCFCKVQYTNFSLYNVVPTEKYQLNFLQSLEKQKYVNVIFWSRPFRMYHAIQMLVDPKDLDLFKERLQHFNLNGILLSDNIQKLFDDQKISKYTRMKMDTFSWDAYHDLEGVYQWMTDIVSMYSDKATLGAIGRSAEGREILAIKIAKPKAKKVIVEGGIHGNEWVTTEFVTYLVYQLLNAKRTMNAKLKQVAKKFSWILIPVANPDGYDYSMKHDRLWRKNRKPFGNGTYGVDLNNNFDYNFCKYGGSEDPASDYYCGTRAFSESETEAISRLVAANTDFLNFYFSFHAYGQKIIIPYSDRVKHIDNFQEMENYGKQGILKMYRLNGVKYAVGTIYDTYGYRESGDSISWVKKTHKIKYVMSFFLRDNGTVGYALPDNQILPACREALVGLVEIMTVRHRHVGMELFSSGMIWKLNFMTIIWFIIIKYKL